MEWQIVWNLDLQTWIATDGNGTVYDLAGYLSSMSRDLPAADLVSATSRCLAQNGVNVCCRFTVVKPVLGAAETTPKRELVEKILNRSPVLRSGYPNVVSVPETEWLALRDYIRSLRAVQRLFGKCPEGDPTTGLLDVLAAAKKHRETYGE